MPSEDTVSQVIDRLTQDYYLLWMGLYNTQYSGRNNDEWGVRWYDFQFDYWEGADGTPCPGGGRDRGGPASALHHPVCPGYARL